MGLPISAGWIVAQGRLVWGLSRKSYDDALADCRRQLGWYYRPGEKAPTLADMETHPATAELVEHVEKLGGGAELGPWHVSEGGIAQPGAGSQRDLFAQEGAAVA